MLGDSSSVKLTGKEQAGQKYDRQEESRYQSTKTVSVFFFSFGRLQLLGNDTEIMSVEVLLYIFLFPSTQEYETKNGRLIPTAKRGKEIKQP